MNNSGNWILEALTILYLFLAFGVLCFLGNVYACYRYASQKATRPIIIKTFDSVFIVLALLLFFKILSLPGIAISMISYVLFFSALDVFHQKELSSHKSWWQYIGFFSKAIFIILAIIIVLSLYTFGSNINYEFLLWSCTFFAFGIFLNCLRAQANKFHSSTPFLLQKIIDSLGTLSYWIYQGLVTLWLLSCFFVSLQWAIAPKTVQDEICLDTGLCREGYIFTNCDGQGNPCTVSKEFCLERNNVWHEKSRSCDTRRKAN